MLKESKEQAKVIRNAARYLTGEAKAGSIMTTGNDNRRTYNQQSSISFAGSNFYINDRQDAYALAVEIAGLTRRQQRGRGLRMRKSYLDFSAPVSDEYDTQCKGGLADVTLFCRSIFQGARGRRGAARAI